MQVVGISMEASANGSEVHSVEMRLHELSVVRHVHGESSPQHVPAPDGHLSSRHGPTSGALDSHSIMFGLHPVRSGRQVSAADMPLALWMQWQSRWERL